MPRDPNGEHRPPGLVECSVTVGKIAREGGLRRAKILITNGEKPCTD